MLGEAKSRYEIFRTPQELRYWSHYITHWRGYEAFLRGVDENFVKKRFCPRPRGVSEEMSPSSNTLGEGDTGVRVYFI